MSKRSQDDGAPAVPVMFSPNDLVGAIKQGLTELHQYMSVHPVPQIDKAVCLAYLERMTHFTHYLPSTQDKERMAQTGGRPASAPTN